MRFDGLARMKAVVLEIFHAAGEDVQDDVFLLALEIGEGRVAERRKVEFRRRRRSLVEAFEPFDPVEPPVLRLGRAGIRADQVIHAAKNDAVRHDVARSSRL